MTDIDINAAEQAEKKKRTKKTVFSFVLGGLAGGLGAAAMIALIDSGKLGETNTSVEIAALVGLVYVVTTLAIVIGLANPKAGATFLNVEDAEEIREQKSMLTYSAIAMGGAGAALIVVALGAPGGLIDPVVSLVVYVALSILAVVVSLRSRRYQDELMRAMGQESGAVAFYLLALVGGSWSVLAHLGFVAAPAALDWLTMMWGLLLLATFIVVGKRGMMTMR